MKNLNDLSKRELIRLSIKSIISRSKIITPEIHQELVSLGFQKVIIGSKQEHEINSRELKENFYGHDFAVGLAAQAISYGCKRKFSALVININDDSKEVKAVPYLSSKDLNKELIINESSEVVSPFLKN